NADQDAQTHIRTNINANAGGRDMKVKSCDTLVFVAISAALTLAPGVLRAQAPRAPQRSAQATQPARQPAPRAEDAVADAQAAQRGEAARPEQRPTEHDRSERFSAKHATPSSPVFKDQAKEGRITGFDFYRDPLNAPQPMTTLEQIMANESAARP